MADCENGNIELLSGNGVDTSDLDGYELWHFHNHKDQGIASWPLISQHSRVVRLVNGLPMLLNPAEL